MFIKSFKTCNVMITVQILSNQNKIIEIPKKGFSHVVNEYIQCCKNIWCAINLLYYL